jgi:hypothetical protein
VKATEFNLQEGIKFDLENGITSFQTTRLVIFDVDAVGLLRQKIIDAVGIEKAREIYLQFGYQHGYADFMQMKINYTFDTEEDLLASGPMLHTWEGIVKATPSDFRINREKGEIYFPVSWKNSYEADQHLQFNPVSKEPVCWSLMGYASGWCTGFFGKPVFGFEPMCRGKGDDRCESLVKPIKEWGPEAKPYIKALEMFWKGV